VPGGTLGVLWSGPDPDGAFVAQARAVLAQRSSDGASDNEFAGFLADADRAAPSLEIPPGAGFDQPEHHVVTWDVALDADELIGLLGTFSWVMTMPDETREGVLAEARRLLRDVLGVEGAVTVDVAFRSDAWRAHTI
jgi:hypothetical protein